MLKPRDHANSMIASMKKRLASKSSSDDSDSVNYELKNAVKGGRVVDDEMNSSMHSQLGSGRVRLNPLVHDKS